MIMLAGKGTATVVARRCIDAPIEVVFDAVTSPTTFERLSLVRRAALVGPRPSTGDLTGAKRRVEFTGGAALEEELLEWSAPTRMRYRIVSSEPVPISGQHGAVTFYQTPDGVEVLWQSTFRIDVALFGAALTRIAAPLVKFAFGRVLALAEREIRERRIMGRMPAERQESHSAVR